MLLFFTIVVENVVRERKERIICRDNIIYIEHSKELSGKLFKRLRESSRLYIQIIISEKILV